MIDEPTCALLQAVVRRESRSLLQYIDEAYPWTRPEQRDLAEQLKALSAEERQETTALVQLLTRHHAAPPHLGTYPMDFTTVNYVTLAHLLPLLLESQQRAMVALERDLEQVRDPEARRLLQQMLDTRQRHCTALKGLACVPHEAVKS